MINLSTMRTMILGIVVSMALGSCVKIIEEPDDQNPSKIVFVDSSTTTTNVNMDSAFILNILQNFKDSSSVMVDARSNVENGSSTTVLGGGGENGGGNSILTKTKVLKFNNGVLFKIPDPSKMTLLYEEIAPLTLKERTVDEIPDRDFLGIFSLGFPGENPGKLKYASRWQGKYIDGDTMGEVALVIDEHFQIVPHTSLVRNNASSYISGLMGSHGEDPYRDHRRTLAGIDGNGNLLVFIANNQKQEEAYEMLCLAGADPLKTITLD